MNLVFQSGFFWWAPGGLNGEKLNVCARYIEGVVKPSLATFALTFATRSAVSPTQLVLPEGGKQGKGATEKGHTHHTRNGIQHARNSPLWKYGKECPTNMASRFLAGRPWKKRLEHLNRKVNSKVAGLFCVGLQNTKITAWEINFVVAWNAEITVAVRINIAEASGNTEITTVVETNWRYLSVVWGSAGFVCLWAGLSWAAPGSSYIRVISGLFVGGLMLGLGMEQMKDDKEIRVGH